MRTFCVTSLLYYLLHNPPPEPKSLGGVNLEPLTPSVTGNSRKVGIPLSVGLAVLGWEEDLCPCLHLVLWCFWIWV